MKIQRILIGFTVLNFGILLFLLTQMRAVEAQGTGTVLRGRMLEIVDDEGRVRASIKIEPAGRIPSGEAYPETVMLRLINPDGRPTVKIGGSEQGGGVGLIGEIDSSHVTLKVEGQQSSLKLTNGKGREHVIEP